MLMERITVTGDDTLLAEYPQTWPARVIVRTRRGRHELSVTHVPGDTARPFGAPEVERKFMRYVSPVVSDATDLLRRSLGVLDSRESQTSILAELRKLH
jgi:2-methylcitrate dehydratase PrpD